LAVGLPAAYLFARYEFRGKTLLKAVTTLPFVMPTIVVAMGFVALFGSQGVVNTVLMNLFGLDNPPIRITNSLTIIFMAHAFYNYSIIVRIVSALWANLDPNLEETAKVLGAGRVRTFYHVTLPLLLPAIVSSSLLAFAFSFTSFGVVLILGGSSTPGSRSALQFGWTSSRGRPPFAGASAPAISSLSPEWCCCSWPLCHP
jgi:thiamine transport system permease protein